MGWNNINNLSEELNLRHDAEDCKVLERNLIINTKHRPITCKRIFCFVPDVSEALLRVTRKAEGEGIIVISKNKNRKRIGNDLIEDYLDIPVGEIDFLNRSIYGRMVPFVELLMNQHVTYVYATNLTSKEFYEEICKTVLANYCRYIITDYPQEIATYGIV